MIYLNGLDCFFSNYFHQDWDLLGRNYEEVIDKFLEDFHDDADAIIVVTAELKYLLDSFPNEPDIKREVEKYGCEYCPYPMNMSYKSWINSIYSILTSHLLDRKEVEE